MWAKLVTWTAQALLIPLIKEGVMALYSWAMRAINRKKKESENQEKSDAYVQSQNAASSADSFSELP